MLWKLEICDISRVKPNLIVLWEGNIKNFVYLVPAVGIKVEKGRKKETLGQTYFELENLKRHNCQNPSICPEYNTYLNGAGLS